MSKLDVLKEILLREIMPSWFNECSEEDKEKLLQTSTGFAEMLANIFISERDPVRRKDNFLWRAFRMEQCYNENPSIEDLGYRGYIERVSNPYLEGTLEYSQWQNGYQEANRDNPPYSMEN